jgi:hypothetical protein
MDWNAPIPSPDFPPQRPISGGAEREFRLTLANILRYIKVHKSRTWCISPKSKATPRLRSA